MTPDDRPGVTRPNGQIYRPRKPIAVVMIENEHRGETEIIVLRTHDVDVARPIAEREARLQGVDWPDDCVWQLSWARKTIRDGEPWWEYDDARGAACVVFSPDQMPAPDRPGERTQR